MKETGAVVVACNSEGEVGACLDALLHGRAIVAAACEAIGGVAQVDPLHVLRHHCGGSVHPSDMQPCERPQLLRIVCRALNHLVNHHLR